MADVSSIDPKDFAPSRPVIPLDKSDFEAAKPEAEANPLAVPGGSQEPIGSRLKRFGRAAAQYDPSVPQNMGRVAPIVAGAAPAIGAAIATEGASIPIQIGAAALGGAAGPYAAAGASKVLGGNPAMPSWRDAAKEGLINAAFAGGGALLADAKGGASAVAPEMERTAPTVKNLNQAVRTRDFWKSLGLSDEQADIAVKSPDAEAFAQRSIENANKTKEAFQGIVDSSRQDFSTRYADAYGDTLSKPIADVSPLVKAFNIAGQPGSERELSPGFAKWLNSKEAQLQGGSKEYVGVGDTAFKDLPKNLQDQIAATTKAQAAPQFTIQDLRDIKTELRENLPGNATPLDKKAATQVQQVLDQVHDSELQKLGATNEQIGRIKGIDADYGHFMDTIKTLDPRSERLGQSVNDALWNPMLQNPDQAANLIRYAKRANELNPEVMPQLRESFLNKAAEQVRTGSSPMEEMKALQTLQAKWGEKGGTQVVLNELFGKDSPMSNPVKLAKVLGAPPLDPQKLNYVQNMASRAASAPYLLRAAVIYGLAGGGMLAITRDPEKAAIAIAGLAGLQLGGKIASRLSASGQEAWVNFRLDPNETNFKNFMKASGAMIGATAEMPRDQTPP